MNFIVVYFLCLIVLIRWEMPEEYKIWYQKVEAASRKRPGLDNSLSNLVASPGELPDAVRAVQKPSDKEARVKESDTSANSQAVIEFSSRDDAMAAFRKLLEDKNIPSTMKFKEVQEICSNDNRWNALKTVGERKQTLAEYQTKKAKLEKDEKKEKAKKAKNAFLQLLAETTAIDSSTRWRDAQRLLSSDHRYKTLESDRDREDIFEEFIVELAKTEREDKEKGKKEMFESVKSFFNQLIGDHKIDRRSLWADVREFVTPAIADNKLGAVSEGDVRHVWLDLVEKMDLEYREAERATRDRIRATVDERESSFKSLLRSLSANAGPAEIPSVNINSTWKDVAGRLEPTEEFQQLNEAYAALAADTDSGRRSSSPAPGSRPRGGRRQRSAIDFFEEFIRELNSDYKEDCRLLKSAILDARISIKHDSSFDDFFTALQTIGEEEKGSNRDKDIAYSLSSILSKRRHNIKNYFESIKLTREEEFREERKAAAKLEARYIDLLEDYYYRSDHIGTTWEQAKDDLYKHSAYANLDRDKRKVLFDKHMADLSEKMAAKKRVAVVNVVPANSSSEAIVAKEDKPNIIVNARSRSPSRRSSKGSLSSRSRSSSSNSERSLSPSRRDYAKRVPLTASAEDGAVETEIEKRSSGAEPDIAESAAVTNVPSDSGSKRHKESKKVKLLSFCGMFLMNIVEVEISRKSRPKEVA